MKPIAVGSALIALAAFGVASTPGYAQWTATNLHPSAGYYNSYALGASATQQVGGVDGEEPRIAGLWSGTSASWMSLHPTEYYGSEATGIWGNQQVGFVQVYIPSRGFVLPRACLWNGSPESFVNLNPSSSPWSAAVATSGTNQVGYASIGNQQHAGMWSDTAASWVDLHPAGTSASAALAISGSLQSGYASIGMLQHAAVWNGTPESRVDLNPVGASSSIVRGAFDMQQVGAATIDGVLCAGLWHRTSASWVNLNPDGSTESVAFGSSGSQQVGYVSIDGVWRASLWSGTAESWVDLSAFLPAGFDNSVATGMWSDGASTFVVGHGYNATTGRTEGLLWTVPAPGAALLGLTGIFVARRSRRGIELFPGRVGDSAVRARPGCRASRAMHEGRGAAFAVVLSLGLVGVSDARAQWTATNLHPAGARSSGIQAVSGTQQGGYAAFDGDGNNFRIAAALWSGTPGSFLSLHPSFHPVEFGSQVTGMSSGLQVGVLGSDSYWNMAIAWNGSPTSYTVLNPAWAQHAYVYGTSGTQQVGHVSIDADGWPRACLWNGTAQSYLNLHPTAPGIITSTASDTSDVKQAGWVEVLPSFVSHASLWSGTPESWVDLHPTGATWSRASAISGPQVGGNAVFSDSQHAGLWNGTAASWVDLHPAGAEHSGLEDMWGTYQVGWTISGGIRRASLWSGDAASWMDLGAFLPAGFTHSQAHGIWSDGSMIHVGGEAVNSLTGQYEAFLWTVPAPGASALLGLSGLFAAGRSRRAVRRAPGSDGKTVSTREGRPDPSSNAPVQLGRRASHAMNQGRNAALAIMLALGIVGVSDARAQWTATNLHPSGARSSGIQAVSGTQQGGHAAFDGNDNRIAALWSGTPGSFVNLHPSSYPDSSQFASTVTGISGGVQVGVLESPSFWNVALAWNGSPTSYTVLNPAWAQHASVYGAFGTQQVGHVSIDEGDWPKACLWNGSAQSYQNLHPAAPGIFSSTASDTSGVRQAGWVEVWPTFANHASLWSGSPDSWVDLHPTGATWSHASAISGSQVGGNAMFSGRSHAGVWSGSAASWVDLHPAGTEQSVLEDMWGTYQVGCVNIGGINHASLWNGDATSWTDLDAFLPSGYTGSRASSIWSDGSVIHVGGAATNIVTGFSEAFVWTVPAPGPAGLLGLASLCVMRRSRRRARAGLWGYTAEGAPTT